MSLTDMDGDGFGYLIVGRYPTGVAIYRNSSSGRFSTKPAQVLDLYAVALATGDFDADGTNDLAV
ncbi:MAG: Repeat domain in Vibrio, Colwellia, Bradyrhizobium and Shewanella, partial [Verrucomicrobiales bacterium]|nr:Repeat domain in Vibrio, Colwellia, Bradyrhizobium and Shewanella [Verrucomicrobiales bacterium]